MRNSLIRCSERRPRAQHRLCAKRFRLQRRTARKNAPSPARQLLVSSRWRNLANHVYRQHISSLADASESHSEPSAARLPPTRHRTMTELLSARCRNLPERLCPRHFSVMHKGGGTPAAYRSPLRISRRRNAIQAGVWFGLRIELLSKLAIDRILLLDKYRIINSD